MARRVFIAHNGADKAQVKGFILLRWNINVDFAFFDRSLVDRVKSKDPAYIRRMIRKEMDGTSVTVVLIGEKTHESLWVEWEIEESESSNNGLVGIRLKGKESAKVPAGLTSRKVPVIGWTPSTFEEAIESAATRAGR